MKKNMGNIDKIIRILVAIVIAGIILYKRYFWNIRNCTFSISWCICFN
jgi:hypothetical protein